MAKTLKFLMDFFGHRSFFITKFYIHIIIFLYLNVQLQLGHPSLLALLFALDTSGLIVQTGHKHWKPDTCNV
jgi:hypothetical protein